MQQPFFYRDAPAHRSAHGWRSADGGSELDADNRRKMPAAETPPAALSLNLMPPRKLYWRWCRAGTSAASASTVTGRRR